MVGHDDRRLGRLEGFGLFGGMPHAGFTRVGGSVKFSMPFFRSPELFFAYHFGHVAVVRTGEVPGQPADAVAVSLRLPVQVLGSKSLQHSLQ